MISALSLWKKERARIFGSKDNRGKETGVNKNFVIIKARWMWRGRNYGKVKLNGMREGMRSGQAQLRERYYMRWIQRRQREKRIKERESLGHVHRMGLWVCGLTEDCAQTLHFSHSSWFNLSRPNLLDFRNYICFFASLLLVLNSCNN